MFTDGAHEDDSRSWQTAGSLVWRVLTAERRAKAGRPEPSGPAELIDLAAERAARSRGRDRAAGVLSGTPQMEAARREDGRPAASRRGSVNDRSSPPQADGVDVALRSAKLGKKRAATTGDAAAAKCERREVNALGNS